jgi:PAS domain S-box-containing protein
MKPLLVAWTILFLVLLVTLAFHLMLQQPPTDLLLKIVGGLLLLIPLYAALGRTKRHGQETTTDTGVVIDAFHDVVQRLREKERELQRLRAEAEARAQDIESYNENILRSVSSGVITFNEDRVMTTFNDAAGRILRMAPGTVIGKACADVFGPRSPVTVLLERGLVQGEVITRKQFELEVPHGERIWVGVSTSLLKDRTGRLIGTTLVCTDLTEIKQLQEQVALQERMTVLGEMSAGIAHEFRNLMGTVLGASKLIAKQLPPGDSCQDNLRTILHVIADMDHLITQLLDFARRTDLDLKPVALAPWLTRVIEQVLEQAPAPHPSVEVFCARDVLEIWMDEVLMRQAVGNLVQNAVEAMPAGGQLTLTAGVRTVRRRRRELELRVRDTGCGIPKARLDKIFLPFYTTKHRGTGLGLALVHKIILLHNGRIEVDSEEHAGTTFRVYLPIN